MLISSLGWFWVLLYGSQCCAEYAGHLCDVHMSVEFQRCIHCLCGSWAESSFLEAVQEAKEGSSKTGGAEAV